MSAPFQVLSITLRPGPVERLDKALAAAVPEGLGLSRSRLQALIAEGAVRRAGGAQIVDPRFRVARRTRWSRSRCRRRAVSGRGRGHPARHRLRGRRPHRDRQAGRASSCTRRRARRTARWSTRCCTTAATASRGSAAQMRPGIVHRIDKDTSGLLVVGQDRRGAPGAGRAVRRAHARAALPRGHPGRARRGRPAARRARRRSPGSRAACCGSATRIGRASRRPQAHGGAAGGRARRR